MKQRIKWKWVTHKSYVDIETGEIITISNFIRNYYEVKREKKVITENQYKINEILIQCRKHGQTRLNI